jgi:hypothetical protein
MQLKISYLRDVFLAMLFLLPGSAQSQSLLHVDQPLYYMTATTPTLAMLKRIDLIQYIWGQATPDPKAVGLTFPGTASGGEMAPAYFGRTPQSSIWLAFYQDHYIVARTYYATFAGSDCLAIVNGGHSQGFFNTTSLPNYNIAGVDALVRSLAGKPCDIILNSMPIMGENRFAAAYIGINPDTNEAHAQMAALLPTKGSSLKYFLDPALSSLNYALSQRSYSKIMAVGISGGGWATTLLAAIDPRIQRSYAVAGSVPLSYRAFEPEGDWEQYNVPMEYLDLYAMSVAETGRRGYLFYNGKDGCCFQAQAIFPWAGPLRSALASFPGTFGVFMAYAKATHDIQPAFAEFILNDLSN